MLARIAELIGEHMMLIFRTCSLFVFRILQRDPALCIIQQRHETCRSKTSQLKFEEEKMIDGILLSMQMWLPLKRFTKKI